MTGSPANIYDIVAHFARETPEAEAAVMGKVRITYAKLNEQVDALACAMLAADVRRGDRVATLSASTPDFVVTLLAAASIGAIWVGLNPRYRAAELAHVLADADPTLILAAIDGDDSFLRDALILSSTQGGSLRHVVALAAAAPGEILTDHHAFLETGRRISAEALNAARAGTGGRQPCVIVYTSGSTGRPKGALLHHEGMIKFAMGQNRRWPVTRAVALNYLPINHVGSVCDVTLPTFAAGGTVVFMPQFEPEAALRLVETERVSVWGSVPSVFFMQLALPAFNSVDLSSVELIVWEGAAMPLDMVRRLAAIGPPLATNYGMTETTSAVTIVDPTRDLDILAESVGGPFDEVDIRLEDADGHSPKLGDVGEVQTRSPLVMLGYWRNPEATAAAFTADGWFRTGDLAVQRPDGRYKIVGRLKEMYKSGGYNVYPREVEDVLEAHPDVVSAAVVGAPDPIWQEVGVAFVVALGEPPDLEEYCRSRLANYKAPKRFVFLDALPLLPIGKVDKAALRRAALGEAAQG